MSDFALLGLFTMVWITLIAFFLGLKLLWRGVQVALEFIGGTARLMRATKEARSKWF